LSVRSTCSARTRRNKARSERPGQLVEHVLWQVQRTQPRDHRFRVVDNPVKLHHAVVNHGVAAARVAILWHADAARIDDEASIDRAYERQMGVPQQHALTGAIAQRGSPARGRRVGRDVLVEGMDRRRVEQ